MGRKQSEDELDLGCPVVSFLTNCVTNTKN